jgi:uncharacterized protein YggE
VHHQARLRGNRTEVGAVSGATTALFPGGSIPKVIHMSSTLRTLGAGALGALIVAVAVLALRPGPVAGAPATDTTPAQHTITVSGSGKVTIVPDVARINLGVTVTKSSVKAVREAGAQAMNDIIAAVKALGVAEADVQTTNLSLYPQYGTGASPRIVGYQISEQILVTVRDLDKAGDVVDAATAKGANNVNGISFESGDPVKAQNDARAAAVAAARTSAQAMAAAGNVSLGGVVSITDASPVSPIWYATPNAGALKDMSTPVEPGTQDLTATVTVVFSIS